LQIYVGELEKRATESYAYCAQGRDHGEGAHSARRIANTLAARRLLWKIW